MARYIDADKFDTYLRLNHFPSKIMYKGKTIYDYLKEYADKKAEDARGNVRGEWIKDKCSVCGEERAWYGNNPNYCPDCGADMRGGDET